MALASQLPSIQNNHDMAGLAMTSFYPQVFRQDSGTLVLVAEAFTKGRGSLLVHQWLNGSAKRGISIHWDITVQWTHP